jgi:hypothetical protein
MAAGRESSMRATTYWNGLVPRWPFLDSQFEYEVGKDFIPFRAGGYVD